MPRRERRLFLLWTLLTAALVFAMFVFRDEDSTPYHLAWVSFVLVYGLRRWPDRPAAVLFGLITVSTGVSLVLDARDQRIGWFEVSEIPLLVALVGVAVWHLRRHRALVDEVSVVAAADRQRAAERDHTARTGSHAVRTRLTVARGLTELVGATVEDPAARRDVQIVLDELDAATTTVTRLLTLVRLDASTAAAAPTDIDHVLVRLGRRWAGCHRDLGVTSAAGVGVVDAERLELALDALVENAVKFTDTGDRITIRAWREDERLTVSVEDAGSGIPEDDLDRVFASFTTGRLAGARGGTGLGLAMVRAVVDELGGDVNVTSVLGQGSCFTLSMPFPGTSGSPAAVSDRRPLLAG